MLVRGDSENLQSILATGSRPPPVGEDGPAASMAGRRAGRGTGGGGARRRRIATVC